MAHHKGLSKYRIFCFKTREIIAASDTKSGVENYFNSSGKYMVTMDICPNPQGGKDYFVEDPDAQ